MGQGTLPFETIAGQLAAVEYIASLGTRFGTNRIDEVDTSVDKRVALEEGFGVIAAHEAALAQQFVSGLDGKILFPNILWLLCSSGSSFLHEPARCHSMQVSLMCVRGRVRYCGQPSRVLHCMG